MGTVCWNKANPQSDVEDLLPPLASRAGMRSIEDEERDLLSSITAQKERDRDVPQTSSPSALSPGIPHPSSSSSSSPSSSNASSTTSTSWLPISWRRLSDMNWVQKNGWVEKGTGNVLIWGAPNVDNIGRLGDRADIKGNRGL